MTKVTSLNEVHMDSVKPLTRTSNVVIDIIYVVDQVSATNILSHLAHQHVNIYSLIELFSKKKQEFLVFF